MGELTKTYPEGIVKAYYPNGTLKSKIEFKKDLLMVLMKLIMKMEIFLRILP